MPYKERDITKQYFTIGEVAAQFNVAPSLIRFWETEFDELRPRKSKKGNRLFTQHDIETFRTIYHLVKERGYTIPGAREMLKQKGAQLTEKVQVIQALERVRGFLVSLKKEVDGRPQPHVTPPGPGPSPGGEPDARASPPSPLSRGEGGLVSSSSLSQSSGSPLSTGEGGREGEANREAPHWRRPDDEEEGDLL